MPVAQSVTGIVSDAQIAACAKQAGWAGQDLTIAVAVALAESGGRATVVNYLGCVGLWQVYQRVHAAQHPLWTTQWLKNPANNALAAHEIWKSQGWSRGWTTYHSGSYKKYMTRAGQAASAAGGGLIVAGANAALDAGTGVFGSTPNMFPNLTNPENWKRVLLILIGIVCVFTSINLATLDTRLKVAGAALDFVPGGSVAKNVVKSTAKGTVKAGAKAAVKAVK